ncbi:hypothetical protein EJB05_55788, partial [Eragrostis curvula]
MKMTEASAIKGSGLMPVSTNWNKKLPLKVNSLEKMIARVTELRERGLRGEHVVEEFVRQRLFPLRKRDPLAMYYTSPGVPSWMPEGVTEITDDEVNRQVTLILGKGLQPRPDTVTAPFSATNPPPEECPFNTAEDNEPLDVDAIVGNSDTEQVGDSSAHQASLDRKLAAIAMLALKGAPASDETKAPPKTAPTRRRRRAVSGAPASEPPSGQAPQ